MKLNKLQSITPSKYRSVRTTVDGITFHSKREANRYSELKLLERCEKITFLELQVPYKLKVNGILIATYIADFRYLDVATMKTVVEDAKGVITPTYRMKAKLMEALYQIKIVEV